MPVAMKSASQRAGVRPTKCERSSSPAEAAPGPRKLFRAPRLHPRVVVDEAQQAGREAAERERRVAEEACRQSPRGERVLDGLDRLREHVPEQEEQDPGRGRAQERLEALPDVVQPPHRQADEDREAGDRAEQRESGRSHHGL